MRILNTDSSVESFWESIAFTVATLESWPETAPLAVELSGHLEGVDSLVVRSQRVRLEVARANAKVAACDLDQEHHLTDLSQDVLVLVGFNRNAPAFTYLFDGPISVIKRHALERQTAVVKGICARLKHEMYPETLRSKHLAVLEADVARAEALLEARREAWLAREMLRLETDNWKREANALRTAVYADLMALHPEEGRGFAEHFFAGEPARSPAPEPSAE